MLPRALPTTLLPLLFLATNLRLGLPARTLAPGFALSLASGERVVLSGPSGAGKSTLLRALVGLGPGRADVCLEGVTVAELGWPELRRRVSLMPQQPVLLGSSVQSVLRRPTRFRLGAGGRFDEPRARRLLSELGIGSSWDVSQASRLSVGEQQRLCLARALLVLPRVLLLDEPLAALDPEAKARALALLRSWADETGGAILMVSHDGSTADSWATRGIELESRSLPTGPRAA